MASLDDDLLALAGDSSDEDAGSPQPKPASASPRPSSSSPDTRKSPQQSNDMARKGVAKAVKPARAAKRSKKPKKEESDEEGELSAPESVDSGASVAMEESDTDEPVHVDGDGPIFPYEKLYYSAKDKQEIMALPEIQREEILSERSQQVDRHNQDVVLRRLLASREREQARAESKAKRKASAAELEEGQRKSSRQKTTLGGRKVGEASDAIEAYKRQREQKGKRDEQRRRDANSRLTRAQSSSEEEGAYSDADADGDSEVEYDNRANRSPSGPPPPKDDSPAELRDLQRARVGRSNFAQVCFHPTFEQSLTGCFSRVNIGPNADTGQNSYRICIIKRFSHGRPYTIEGANGRSYVTDTYAVLAHGKSEREFPFIQCSDSPFTDAEFNRWRHTLASENVKMPTKSMLNNKVVDINNLINYKFTADELEEKLRKQGTANVNEKLFKRYELERQLKEAIAQGNDDEINRLQVQLAKESTPKPAFGGGLNKIRPEKHQTPEQRLAELNRRNQRLNSENVRRAQLEERRRNRENAAAIARGEASADPMARVRTIAKTRYDVNTPADTPKKDDAANGASNAAAVSAKDSPVTAVPKVTSATVTQSKPKGIAVIRHRNMDDENIAALDLDLDGDLDLGF